MKAKDIARELRKETAIGEPKHRRKDPVARETQGEGAPKRNRREGLTNSEEAAEPERGNEPVDARLIERKRDAHNPEGI